MSALAKTYRGGSGVHQRHVDVGAELHELEGVLGVEWPGRRDEEHRHDRRSRYQPCGMAHEPSQRRCRLCSAEVRAHPVA